MKSKRTGSPAKRDADRRAVESQVLELLAGLEVVLEIAPRGDHFAPAERVADPRDALPREIGVPGSDIGVIGDEPFAARSEVGAALDADDGVPVVQCGLDRSLAGGADERTEFGIEFVAESRLDV